MTNLSEMALVRVYITLASSPGRTFFVRQMEEDVLLMFPHKPSSGLMHGRSWSQCPGQNDGKRFGDDLQGLVQAIEEAYSYTPPGKTENIMI